MKRHIESLKFNLVSFLFLALLAGLGYWAFTTLETGSGHVNSKKQKEIEKENKVLEEENLELKRELELLLEEKRQKITEDQTPQKPEIEEPQKTTETQKPSVKAPTVSPEKTLSQKEILINELTKLSDKNIILKLKSTGTAVGTVQKFLNLYNKTSNKIDNDYGLTTVNAVKSFQKAQGLSVTGQCNSTTYKKMISWLKK